MIRHVMVPIAAAIVMMSAGTAFAQSSFPAPMPGQAIANDPAFPPVNGGAPRASIGAPAPQASFPMNGAAPLGGGGFGGPPPAHAGGPSEQCTTAFKALGEERERRGKLIKAASDRHAPPDEACKLIGAFGQAEAKMIDYMRVNASKCGIPAQAADQLKAIHKGTESTRAKVCQVAEQMKTRGPAGPSLSEVLGAGAAPEANVAKKGGSTFDTLNGNVLTR